MGWNWGNVERMRVGEGRDRIVRFERMVWGRCRGWSIAVLLWWLIDCEDENGEVVVAAANEVWSLKDF